MDLGPTGTNRDRPGLRQALAACRAGDTLVVTKLDHLARSLWPSGLQDVKAVISRPLEERPQVVAVGLERAPLVAGQERRRGQFGLVDGVVPSLVRSISGIGISSVTGTSRSRVRWPRAIGGFGPRPDNVAAP